MKPEQLFRSLVTMIAADGEMTPPELRFLQNLRQQLDISEPVINSALQDVKQGKRRVSLPKSQADRNTLLHWLIQAAYADGTVMPEEYTILQAVADKSGVSSTELETMIRDAGKKTLYPSVSVETECILDFSTSQAEASFTRESYTPVAERSRPLAPSAASKTRRCPKCGYRALSPEDPLYTGDNGNGECPACGIFLRRYQTSTSIYGFSRKRPIGANTPPKKRSALNAVVTLLLGAMLFFGYQLVLESQQREIDPQATAKLAQALNAGKANAVREALKNGANMDEVNVHARNKSGLTPLHLFSLRNNYDIVELLLEHGANPNVADGVGWTPLHNAARAGFYSVAKRLLEAGANVNMRTYDTIRACRGKIYPYASTPLAIANIEGRKNVAALLRKHGGRE